MVAFFPKPYMPIVLQQLQQPLPSTFPLIGCNGSYYFFGGKLFVISDDVTQIILRSSRHQVYMIGHDHPTVYQQPFLLLAMKKTVEINSCILLSGKYINPLMHRKSEEVQCSLIFDNISKWHA